MAVDRRGYAYRSVRDGCRVRRIYLGRGPAAELSELLVSERRDAAAEVARHWQEADQARAPAEAALRALDGLANRMFRATLLAAGYHRHDRGAWRRRRMSHSGCKTRNSQGVEATKSSENAPSPAPNGVDSAPASAPADRPGAGSLAESELRVLLRRAEQGDPSVLPALRALLDARPALWQHCGDVARLAEADWVDLIAGRDLLVRESLRRSLAAQKADLAGADASPLERLLAERVAITRLQVNHADSALAGLRGQGATIAQLDMMQRRQERTQRTYLAAIRELATVRRLQQMTPVAAPAKTEAEPVAVELPKSPPRKGRVRSRAVASEAMQPSPTRHPDRDGGKAVAEGRTATVVGLPKVLQDRLKGLVGSDN